MADLAERERGGWTAIVNAAVAKEAARDRRKGASNAVNKEAFDAHQATFGASGLMVSGVG